MSKSLRRFTAVVAVLLILALIALFCRDPFLKLAARQAIQKSTGMKVEIAKLKTGLRHPAITMQGLKLYNYTEFGNSVLLDVPDLFVEFDQELAKHGKLRFKQLRIRLAELNVLRDAAGRWNLEKVEREMTERNVERTRHGQPKLEFAGIDEMRLSIGRVTFRNLQNPSKSREILVNTRDELVTGLKTDEDLQEWIGDFIFKVILQQAISPSSKRKGKPVEALKEALDQ